MKLLAIWVDVAVFGIDITPVLFSVGPGEGGLVGILSGRLLVLGLPLGLLLLLSDFLHLFRHVLLDVRFRGVGEKSGQGHQLCVAGAVAGDVGGIHASGDDSALVDEHTSDWCLIGLQ